MLSRMMSLKWSRFFHIFSAELSCFTPFLIISSATTLTNVSELYFTGKLNSMTQVFIIFVIVFVPLLSFLILKTKAQNNIFALRKVRNGIIIPYSVGQKIEANLLEAVEAFTSSVMSFYIPFCILVQSPMIFFIFTTPLIFKRIITIFSNIQVFYCYKNLVRFFTTLAWTTHHFSFLGLYVI